MSGDDTDAFGPMGSNATPPGAGPLTAPPPAMPDMSPQPNLSDPRIMTPGVGVQAPSAADVNSAASPAHHAISLLGPNHPVSKFLTGMGSLLMHQSQLPGGMTHAQALGGGGTVPTSAGNPAMPVDPMATTRQHIAGAIGQVGQNLMNMGGGV